MKKKTNQEFIDELKRVNPSITPLEEYKGTKKKILFECKICGYKWPTTAGIALRGHGCSKCAKKAQLTHDEFVNKMKIINPSIKIASEYTNYKSRIKCICNICNHEWPVSANNLVSGSSCPKCAKSKRASNTHLTRVKNNNFAINSPNIAAEWDYESNNGKLPKEFSNSSDYDANWICPLGHKYTAKICARTDKRKPSGCPECNKYTQTSFPEQAVFYYIKQVFPDAVNKYRDKSLKLSELDIYIPSKKIGIEYDGFAWHKHSKKLEENKYNVCKKNGIKLIRLRESTKESFNNAICDVSIYSDYINTRYSGLDACILSLLEYFEIPLNVNTERDALLIREQYSKNMKEKSLAKTHPHLVNEWNFELNGNLTPEMFTFGSQQEVHWICPKGHKYQAKIGARANGTGCQKCYGNAKKNTKQFIEELKQKNPYIEVLGEYVNSKTGILSRCLVCGHEWSPTPNTVLRNHGCPKCGLIKMVVKREKNKTESR